MKIEHVALNVPDALSMARWYCEHLGMTVKRKQMESPWAHFLVDSAGTSMLELYQNAAAPIPDYPATDPLVLHIAFSSDDVRRDAERLIRAGATQVGDPLEAPNGDVLIMLRDPWGVAIQLAHRAKPLL